MLQLTCFILFSKSFSPVNIYI